MTRKIFYFLCLFFITTIEIKAQENLEPNSSVLNEYSIEYYSKIREILLKDISPISEMQYIVVPSFSPEYLLNVYFDITTEKYCFQFSKCDISIWSTMDNHKNKNKKPKVSSKKKYIDENSFKIIQMLYKKAIDQTKYFKKDYIISDGEHYYFIINENGESKSGTVHSPYEGRTKKLVDINEKLIKFIESENKEIDSQLKNEIQKLSDEF